MNRLIKYSESINRFIDCKKDYVTRIINIDNAILLNKIKNNDKIFSVIMLTILNNTCRKNKLSVNGYYMTILIEILSIIIFDDVIDVKTCCKNVIMLFGLLNENVGILMHSVNSSTLLSYYTNVMSSFGGIILKIISSNNDVNDDEIEFTDGSLENDLSDWYFNDNSVTNLDNFKQISKKTYMKHINNYVNLISEISFMIGWLLGGGVDDKIESVKLVSTYFSVIYNVVNDFENIDRDMICMIKDDKKFCYNHVINYGILNSFELYMNNKEKFIELSIKLDIYTDTIKEILRTLEEKIDVIINDTNPELKSNYSDS